MVRKLEKRSTDRIKTPRFIIEYMIDGNDTQYSVEVINISSNGLCFIRDSVLKKGDMIRVKFPFKTRKIVLTGHIIRLDGREAAVKFAETEKNLEKFVETFNQEYPLIKANPDITGNNHKQQKKSRTKK